ncbi:hypothetical protein [Neolewinella persica]|uniref:hypothetical protein n=1 Tax=Neolewinella persica TaxID=70998 RepID=UPI00036F7E7E|nr:hypothetical protein [Neolewinella persica]
MYNPRTDKWDSHFGLGQSGELIPLSDEKLSTILLLRLNDDETKVLRKILIDGGVKLAP